MKPIQTFKIGSSYFFMDYEDYYQKDLDELCIMDKFPEHIESNVLNMRKDKRDVFFYRNLGKEVFIQETLESGVPMKAGKFLIPEFAEYLGMTIEDLKALEKLFEVLDEKHSYEKTIYKAYLENNRFQLTPKQRDAAYKEYKRARAEIYNKDNIIIKSYQYLSSLEGIGRFVYGGSYGLWINGIDLERKFHDIDIKFLDFNEEDKLQLKLDFFPKIDKLPDIPEELQVEEKEWNGIRLLVFTPESIIRAKQYTLDFLSDPKTFMTEGRKRQKDKILRDFRYLREHYELEI